SGRRTRPGCTMRPTLASDLSSSLPLEVSFTRATGTPTSRPGVTPTNKDATMNILLWVLQVVAALLYAASGVMKTFMFDKASEGVQSFGALPRKAWMALGIVELICVVGLIVPAAFRWQPTLTVVAASILAAESFVFIGVHVKYREIPP